MLGICKMDKEERKDIIRKLEKKFGRITFKEIDPATGAYVRGLYLWEKSGSDYDARI